MEQISIVSSFPDSIFIKALQLVLSSKEKYEVQLIPYSDAGNEEQPGFYIYQWNDEDYDKIPDSIAGLQQRQPDALLLVVIQTSISTEDIKRLISLGGMGIISMSVSAEKLVHFVEEIRSRKYQWVFSNDILSSFIKDTYLPASKQTAGDDIYTSKFSFKENQIIQLAKKGFTISETAEELTLSKNTIAAYRSSILRKSGAKSLFELVSKLP